MKPLKLPLKHSKMGNILTHVMPILDIIEQKVCIINKDYEIVSATKSLIQTFNKNESHDILNTKCFCLHNNIESICENCPAEKYFKEGVAGQPVKVEHVINEKKIIFRETCFPLVDNNGNTSFLLIDFKDCTHEIALENQLSHLEQAVGVGKLVTGAVHEIRGPLGNIIAASQILLKKADSNKGIKEYLRIILRNSERINKIIKELLKSLKPHELTLTIGSVDDVIDNILMLVKERLLKHKIHLATEISKRQLKILVDTKLLEEMFINLINNAIEAMPQGGKLSIKVDANENDNQVEIKIIDTGAGISEYKLKKIFDPFFTTKKDGTGLGLLFAQQIVGLHKGKIEIKSKLNSGTEAKIILPLYNGKLQSKIILPLYSGNLPLGVGEGSFDSEIRQAALSEKINRPLTTELDL